MAGQPTLVFLGMLGAPGRYDPGIFAHMPGDDDELTWMRLLLKKMGLDDRVSYCGVKVSHGETPPDPADCDGVIVGGSFHSVNERLSWQMATVEWLRRYRATGRPLLGICGGHQLVCTLLGGTVEPMATGTMAGTFPVRLTDRGRTHALFAGLGQAPAFHFGNGEHVVRPPVGATVLADRTEDPACALDHGAGWMTVQFHPEAETDTFKGYWEQHKPANIDNYRPVPDAQRLIANFVLNTGVLKR